MHRCFDRLATVSNSIFQLARFFLKLERNFILLLLFPGYLAWIREELVGNKEGIFRNRIPSLPVIFKNFQISSSSSPAWWMHKGMIIRLSLLQFSSWNHIISDHLERAWEEDLYYIEGGGRSWAKVNASVFILVFSFLKKKLKALDFEDISPISCSCF